MSQTLKYDIPKLNGTNYFDWVFGAEIIFRAKDCHDVVTGERTRPRTNFADWDEKATLGLTIIGLTVEPSQYAYLREVKSGPEAWDILKKIYNKPSRANRTQLKRRFYQYKAKSDQSMQSYISAIADLASQLKAIKVPLEDDDIIDVLIMNLPEEYSAVASALNTRENLTLSDVTGALIDDEARRHTEEPDDTGRVHGMANQARTSAPNRGKRPETQDSDRRQAKCYFCHEEGHIIRDCPVLENLKKLSKANTASETNNLDYLRVAY